MNIFKMAVNKVRHAISRHTHAAQEWETAITQYG